MLKGNFPLDKFGQLQTPFYYYDMNVLRSTVDEVGRQAGKADFRVHYALKANVNPAILREVRRAGFGADCVSGGEIQAAIDAGIAPESIVFAGVGKADWEINLALDHNIFCFNVESVPELEVIDALAARKNRTARVALRLNPNVNAHTHHYITTGIEENKFGIYLYDLEHVLTECLRMPHIELIGLHFHVGSQITDMTVFRGLCLRATEILDKIKDHGIAFPYKAGRIPVRTGYAHRLYELVRHTGVIGCLHCGHGVGEPRPFPLYQQVVGQFYAIPSLVPVHGIVAAYDTCYRRAAPFCQGCPQSGTFSVKFLHEPFPAHGVAVPAIHKAMHIDFRQTIPGSHVKEFIKVVQGTVYPAVGTEAHKVQLLP